VRCVNAILAGRVLPAEVIIVDQSEDDATAALVARQDWGGRLPVRYISAPPRGLAASRNIAVAHASSSIIAFTDDDCVADEGWLAAIASAFDGPDHVAVVTGRILPLGPDRPGFYATSTRDGAVRALYRGRSLPWTVGSGGNTAVRREWLERVGGFDERLGAGTAGLAGEDTDLLYRLLCAGATVCYEPDALVLHERKESDRHLATRPAYGFGMGAFCALSARRRDAYALWMLGRWGVDRARRLAGGCVRRQWRRVREELLMLRGAWSGLTYGARVETPQ
jgi:GT2 family glycosyltransferase